MCPVTQQLNTRPVTIQSGTKHFKSTHHNDTQRGSDSECMTAKLQLWTTKQAKPIRTKPSGATQANMAAT